MCLDMHVELVGMRRTISDEYCVGQYVRAVIVSTIGCDRRGDSAQFIDSAANNEVSNCLFAAMLECV